MMFNKTFIKTICITLMVTFLAIFVGRVTSVYALADPVIPPELAPVFDTEVINLQDYVADNLSASQGDVFNILLGFYLASQAGFAEYKLADPYTTQDGIIGWLKSCGLQLYNSLVGMGAIGIDPLTGIDYRPYIKGAADIAMGCAVKASQYEDVNDFVSDVNVHEKYFVPMDFGIQGSLNYIFSKNGGLYNWQFDVGEFISSVEYNNTFLAPTSNYWTLLASFTQPLVRANYSSDIKNVIVNNDFFGQYTNILLNTSDGYIYFYTDSGEFINDTDTRLNCRLLWYNATFNESSTGYYNTLFHFKKTYPSLGSYQNIIQYLVDNPDYIMDVSADFMPFINDFVQHYYYGSSWSNKTEIFHSTNLNLDENSLPYYQQVGNDYLLDIKGILNDLIGEVDLTNVVLNNLLDLNGVIVTDPKLTRVATEILEEIQVNNPPLPVNLNDIAEYTDNTYLERVKENARNFGDIFANYIFFWHNCDAELVYVCFGAGILVLIGAFIGKWGHS